MKKITNFCLLLLMLSFGNLIPNISTVDTARMTQRFYDFYSLKKEWNGAQMTTFASLCIPTVSLIENTIQLSDSIQERLDQDSYVDPQQRLKDMEALLLVKAAKSVGTDVEKYLIWYTSDIKKMTTEKHHSVAGAVAGPVIFAAVNAGINGTTKALNEYDAVKNITQNIPEFVSQNGKLVAAAMVAETARTAIEQGTKGMTSDNAIKFGKKATVQVGANFIEEFGIVPMTDSIENSTTKKAVRYGLGLATVAGLDLVTGGKGSIDLNCTVTL